MYWSNGQLRYEGAHDNFVPNGQGKWYDMDGQLSFEGGFKFGKMHGMGTIYYD